MAFSSWTSAGKSDNKQSFETVNYARIEAGKPLQFAILGDVYEFYQHTIKGKKDGKDAYRNIRCDGDCPICKAGRKGMKATRKFAFNIVNLVDNNVQVLIVGRTVIEQIQSYLSMGIDMTTAKWIVNKSGQGTSTTYTVMQMGLHGLNLAEYEAKEYDLDESLKEHDEETMKKILAGIGVDWNEITTEETFKVPTLAEAKAMQVTFGKHKGKTLGQIWAEDKSSNSWIDWFAYNSNPSEMRNGARVILSEELGVHFDDLNP